MERRYFEGYAAARAKVEHMDLDELLSTIDSLFGRDALKYGDDVEAVRAEALRQVEREFTNPEWVKHDKPFIDALVATVKKKDGW